MSDNEVDEPRLVTVLDQEDEQIEIARNERLFEPLAREHAAPRRKHELAEAVARHGGAGLASVLLGR